MKYCTIKRNNDNALSTFGFGPFGQDFDSWFTPFFTKKTEYSLMKTDIVENDNGYDLIMEVPGFDKNDIDISVENGYLTVSAKCEKDNTEESEGRYVRRERVFGNASRSFYIGDVPQESIKAVYSKGILTVTVPKEEKKLPEKHQIVIE